MNYILVLKHWGLFFKDACFLLKIDFSTTQCYDDHKASHNKTRIKKHFPLK